MSQWITTQLVWGNAEKIWVNKSVCSVIFAGQSIDTTYFLIEFRFFEMGLPEKGGLPATANNYFNRK